MKEEITEVYNFRIQIDPKVEYMKRDLSPIEHAIYDIYKDSSFFTMNAINKTEQMPIYEMIRNRLSNEYSIRDIVLGCIGALDFNADFLYNNLTILDKEAILREYSDRIKTKKLF